MSVDIKVIDSLYKAIKIIIAENNKDLKFDKTYAGTVKSINIDGTYNVEFDGSEHTNIKISHVFKALIDAKLITLSVGDVVYMKALYGNFSFKYIYDKMVV